MIDPTTVQVGLIVLAAGCLTAGVMLLLPRDASRLIRHRRAPKEWPRHGGYASDKVVHIADFDTPGSPPAAVPVLDVPDQTPARPGPVSAVHQGATEAFGAELRALRDMAVSPELAPVVTPAQQMALDHDATGGISTGLIAFDRAVWDAVDAFLRDAELGLAAREHAARCRAAFEQTRESQAVTA